VHSYVSNWDGFRMANSSGLLGRNLMVQSNQAVYGTFDEEIRWYKSPPHSPSPNTGITPTKARTSSTLIAT
jgi:hypothetical protein